MQQYSSNWGRVCVKTPANQSINRLRYWSLEELHIFFWGKKYCMIKIKLFFIFCLFYFIKYQNIHTKYYIELRMKKTPRVGGKLEVEYLFRSPYKGYLGWMGHWYSLSHL